MSRKLQDILNRVRLDTAVQKGVPDEVYINEIKDLMLEILKASYKKGWFSDTVYQELCVEVEQL